jgi:cell wall-associated NlpC family hydrolase
MSGLSISRTCREQYADTRRIKKSQLQEGDLVFFKTRGKSISHVGIYLRNNKFIHASTSSGVMISDLNEDYFDARYAGAGRIPG